MCTTKKLEVVTNVAILVVVIALGVVIVKQYLLSPTEHINKSISHPYAFRNDGQRLNLHGIDWKKNGQTIVMALSSTCPYCTDSAPFYKQLEKESNAKRIVIQNEPVSVGQEYLTHLGLSVDEIKQVQLKSIGVSGTPTLLIVDENGVVKDSWVGILTPKRQAEVLELLRKTNKS